MSEPPVIDMTAARRPGVEKVFTRGRMIVLYINLAALLACLGYSWMTQDAATQLSFLRQKRAGNRAQTSKAIVSIDAWQTASTLLPMAVSAEEQDYAREAERLADHEVDQAFAAAMRAASLRSRHVALSGPAQQLTQKVADLEQLVKQDRQQVRDVGGDPGATAAPTKNGNVVEEDDDLQLARAQLSLDSGELDDARKNLAILLGDNSDQIQTELNAYHLAQQQAQNARPAVAEHAVASVKSHRTLQMRLAAWQRQNERTRLLTQASAQVAAEEASLVSERDEAVRKVAADMVAASARQSRLDQLRDREGKRQLLAVYNDRIDTDKQLEAVYRKWIAQVCVQHRILIHFVVISLAWIFFVILATVSLNALTQIFLNRMSLDNRQSHTLRTLIRLCLQLVGAAIVLLILFGVPEHAETALGLTTAALTIALQDFVLAILGWFLLMGRQGVHVGDWVEINGVNGEVAEVGLFNTALLELNSLNGKGRPTGRRISFLNSFAIRGQYFNFSTSSQWMWDEVSIGIPKALDVHQVASEIEALVREKTEDDARAAERDWQRVAHGSTLTNLAASSTVSLRPTADGIEATVHYVTRATERLSARDHLYVQLLEFLRKRQSEDGGSH